MHSFSMYSIQFNPPFFKDIDVRGDQTIQRILFCKLAILKIR